MNKRINYASILIVFSLFLACEKKKTAKSQIVEPNLTSVEVKYKTKIIQPSGENQDLYAIEEEGNFDEKNLIIKIGKNDNILPFEELKKDENEENKWIFPVKQKNGAIKIYTLSYENTEQNPEISELEIVNLAYKNKDIQPIGENKDHYAIEEEGDFDEKNLIIKIGKNDNILPFEELKKDENEENKWIFPVKQENGDIKIYTLSYKKIATIEYLSVQVKYADTLINPSGENAEIFAIVEKDNLCFDEKQLNIKIDQNQLAFNQLQSLGNNQWTFVVKNKVGFEITYTLSYSYQILDKHILICTPQELQNIKNNLSGQYLQGRDIDLSSIENFEPIGTADNSFRGAYDGHGKLIQNLQINRADQENVGLFGYTNVLAKLENITLFTINVNGKNNIGGLVGYAANSTIKNIKILGESTLTGYNYMGGLIGYSKLSNLENSQSNANILVGSDGKHIGGLIGYAEMTNILNSYTTGHIRSKDNSSADNIGGLVGTFKGPINGANFSKISDSYATGDVNFPDQGSSLGGLIGMAYLQVEILNSYATGNLEGRTKIGGLIGDLVSSKAMVSKNYAKGNVIGQTSDLGGLIGSVRGTKIEYNYATGSVISVKNWGHVGGLIGNIGPNSSINQAYATGHVRGGGFGSSISTKAFVGKISGISTSIKNSFIGDQSVTINNILVTSQSSEGIKKLLSHEINQQTFKDATWDFDKIWTFSGIGWPTLQNPPK